MTEKRENTIRPEVVATNSDKARALEGMVPDGVHELITTVASTQPNETVVITQSGPKWVECGVISTRIDVLDMPSDSFETLTGYTEQQDDGIAMSFPGYKTKVIPNKIMYLYTQDDGKAPHSRSVSQYPIGLAEVVFTDGEKRVGKRKTRISNANVAVLHRVSGSGVSGLAHALYGNLGKGVPAKEIWKNDRVPWTHHPLGLQIPVDMIEVVEVYLGTEQMEMYKQNLASQNSDKAERVDL